MNVTYLKEDTITALSTAVGRSAMAVIRLSGKASFQIVDKIFRTNSNSKQQVKYGYILDGTEKKDEVVCIFFKAPHTYTGENLVEVSVHGNPVIINEVLNLLYKNGARPAKPGEFTYRAFLNGKKDLAEAEAICALIASKTEKSAKVALNNVAGELSSKIKSIKNNLTNFIAFMEVNLDHPEENIALLSCDEKLIRIDSYIKEIQGLLDFYKTSKTLQFGIKAVIIGKPNVGKSSLFNAILGKNRVIVTDIAGTTTDIIEEVIDCHGFPLTIIDTAGIRDHIKSPIEFLGQKKTEEIITEASILIWVFDASCRLDKNDIRIADYLNKLDLNIPVIGVLNKSDLPIKISLSNNFNINFRFISTIGISTKNKDGISNLLYEFAKITNISTVQGEYLMINSRHFTLLQSVLKSLIKTKQALIASDADEIACFEAIAARNALNEILGININENILDAIFSSFCIGK
jgi:tRNA modification GTPase